MLVAVLAAIIGVGTWLLVNHYTGSSRGITDSQATTFIQTGAGLPGLNVVSGNPNMHGAPLPIGERSYALRMYRCGPYQLKVLNLFYAVGATSTHFMSRAQRQAVLAVGQGKLIARTVASATHPDWITQYGITVRRASTAVVLGMIVGAAK